MTTAHQLPTVIDTSPPDRLDEIAHEVEREHNDVARHLERALRHALKAGDLLREAKSLIPHGQWAPWVEENCRFSYTTAIFYIRLSHYQEILPNGVNLEEARDYLRGLPAADGNPRSSKGRSVYPEAVREEALRLKVEGKKLREISDILNVPIGTLANWRKPQRGRRKYTQRKIRERQLLRVEQREQKRREAEKAARQRGGSLSKAYSVVRLLGQELERARTAETDPEAKKHLNQATQNANQAEYAICYALGVDYGKWRDVS